MRKPKLRPVSFYEIDRYLTKSWRPLHRHPIHTVTRKDVAARLNEIERQNGVSVASRARAALSALFAWAIQQGYRDDDPVIGTAKPEEGPGRDRVLTDVELAEVWNACADDEYGKIVRLLILTGQRRDEVGAMQWSELDHEREVWTLPAARAKNHKAHALTLPPAAWAIIHTVPRKPNGYLFGRKAGFTCYSLYKPQLDARVQIEPWVIHDLRRTVATRIADLGIASPHVIEQLLNHVSGHKAGVAGIYNRSSYERETRNALAMWADHVASITQNTKRTIIPIREIPA